MTSSFLLFLAGLCLMKAAPATNASEGDFAFVHSGDIQMETQRTEPVCPVRRLWGVSDVPAYVGRMFQLRIPKEAFSGKVTGYKVTGSDGSLPSWLTLDSHNGVLRGIPTAAEKGEHRLLVTALYTDIIASQCSPASDVFTIEVKNKRDNPSLSSGSTEQCQISEDKSQLIILIGRPFHQITPTQRLNAIINLASFMALEQNEFTIQPHEITTDKNTKQDLVIMSGPGDSKRKHIKATTEILLDVGCSGTYWSKHRLLVHQIAEQVKDGTISYTIRLPVAGWSVIRHKQIPLVRKQRQILEGSAYGDDYEDGEDYEDEEEVDSGDSLIDENDEDMGNGDEYNNGFNQYDGINEMQEGKSYVQIVPEPVNTTEESIQENVIHKYKSHAYAPPPVIVFDEDTTTEESSKAVDEVVVQTTIPETATRPLIRTYDLPDIYKIEEEEQLTTVSDMMKESTFNAAHATSPKDTTPAEIYTTEKSSTIIGRTTETVVFTFPANSAPVKQHRTKKVAVTAGKYFIYIIPEDLFLDAEDGKNLQLAMYDIEHVPLKSSSWVQFNPQTREVYGLPLEEHVSKWEYIIEATDSKGATAFDTLDITVQQHKGRRTVNHEFSMKLRILKKFPAEVDWQIKALRGLVSLFRDTDMDQITVRDVNLSSDPIEFLWTNDTLPKSYCPTSDIDRLMGILQSTPEGEPSTALSSAMAPDLSVKGVTWSGMGDCQAPLSTAPPQKQNLHPMPRNQIDHINATVGKLLVFKVPDDTFYDHEDGSSRYLKMWLTRGDRTPIPSHNWLQFDVKNREFFGVPMEKDIGKKEYQLVCEDSGGLTANDGLLVEVHAGPVIRPTVEFKMTLDSPTDGLMQTAAGKRKFAEKLHTLFNDSDTSFIKIKSITYNPTVISWYNTSLPTDRCPERKIEELKRVMVRDDDSLTDRVDEVMGKDMPVSSLTVDRKGICAVGVPAVYVPDTSVRAAGIPAEDASKTADSDDYLVTFIIPIAVIVCMIIIAALVACILYRRRRTGKMSIGDDEERQAFRSKGIPVIFQDELDEKPDPCNKSPVIMKEEKPPLLPPPEYKGTDGGSPTPSHAPYHPPPPFTASRDTQRNNRPKPTPTYRKPPPYVPP